MVQAASAGEGSVWSGSKRAYTSPIKNANMLMPAYMIQAQGVKYRRYGTRYLLCLILHAVKSDPSETRKPGSCLFPTASPYKKMFWHLSDAPPSEEAKRHACDPEKMFLQRIKFLSLLPNIN